MVSFAELLFTKRGLFPDRDVLEWLRRTAASWRLFKSCKLDILAGAGPRSVEVAPGIGGNGTVGGGGGGSALFLSPPIWNQRSVLLVLLVEAGDLLLGLIKGFSQQIEASTGIGSAASSNICSSCSPSAVWPVLGLTIDSRKGGKSFC